MVELDRLLYRAPAASYSLSTAAPREIHFPQVQTDIAITMWRADTTSR
jgi:hypothetical protein